MGDHTITVVATGPDAISASNSYTLSVIKNCDYQILTPIVGNFDETYKVRDPLHQHEIPEFDNDESVHCPVVHTVSFDPLLTWISPLVSGRGIEYYTDTNTLVNSYTITVTATGETTQSASTTFELIVIPDCTQQIITPSATVDQTYTVYDLANSYEVPEFGNDEATHCPLTY